MVNSFRLGSLTVAGVCLALLCNMAFAQSKLYKHVDASGAVTYTDQPDKDEKPMAIVNTARNGDGGRAVHAAAKAVDGPANGTKNKAAGGAAGGHRRAKTKGGSLQE